MIRQKKSSDTITIVFIAVQLVIVFFYIHHQSSLNGLSLQGQKYEQKKLVLAKQKSEVTHELHKTHDLSRIKDYALQAKMQKITLDQIKSIPDERPTA
jgi:hypothetical protein